MCQMIRRRGRNRKRALLEVVEEDGEFSSTQATDAATSKSSSVSVTKKLQPVKTIEGKRAMS